MDEDEFDEYEHQPVWLTTSRYGCMWICACGAEGGGNGHPAVGWAIHVAGEAAMKDSIYMQVAHQQLLKQKANASPAKGLVSSHIKEDCGGHA